MEIFAHPSILNKEDVCCTTTMEETWIDPILIYIQNENLPKDKLFVEKCLFKSTWF